MKRGKKFFSFILAFTILFTLNLNLTYADDDDNDPVKVVLRGREPDNSQLEMVNSMTRNLQDILDGKISTRSNCSPDHYSIINGDNRSLSNHPIPQIVLIRIKYKGISEPAYATGFYAGPGKLLTVAHAVIGEKGEKEIEWATAYFVLNRFDTQENQYIYTVVNSPIYNTYITRYYQRFTSKKYDYAVMRLEGEVYFNNDKLTPLRLAKPNELSGLAERRQYVMGYANPATHYRLQRSGSGFLKDEPGNRYYYDIDIEPGQSGSPIFFDNGREGLIVTGINTDGAGINYSPYPKLNSGLKLRYEIHEFLGNCEW